MTTTAHHVPTEAALAETHRTEAFSDGVLAIALTLLVLNLSIPASQQSHLASAVFKLWPAYVSFLASFAIIAVTWLNHHAAFRRIRSVDRLVILANMGVLLGAVLLPFPAAVLANAFSSGNHTSEQVAVLLYAAVGVFISLTWFLFYLAMHRRAHLAHEWVSRGVWRTECYRALIGVLVLAIAGALGALVTPVIALVLFCVVPIFYGVSSEGLPGRAARFTPRFLRPPTRE